MGMKKSLTGILPLLAMAMMGDMGNTPFREEEALTNEQRKIRILSKKKKLEEADERKRLRQGQQKFYYGESFIWALNKENADRKAYKKGLLK